MPNPGVPPAEVLQKLVPHETLRNLAQWTETHYNETKKYLRRQHAERKKILTVWNSVHTSSLLLNQDINTKYEMPKISPDLKSPYPMIVPKHEMWGVQPSGGALKGATTCLCEQKPTYYVRKVVSKHVKWWFDDLKNPKSSK